MNRRHSNSTVGSPSLWGVWRVLSLLCLPTALGACLGGQTGTEESGKPATDSGAPACVPQISTLAAAETSPLGFTPDSVLAAVTGSRSSLLSWSEPSAELGFGPEQGVGSVELSVDATSEGARFVHWAPRALGADVGGCAPDEVQLDAQISFATGGGAFAERFPAVLHVTQPDAARITLSLPLATLSGTFSVSPAPGFRTSTVVLDAEITAQGTSGTLRGQLEQTLGSVASVRFLTYACWPVGDSTCFSP